MNLRRRSVLLLAAVLIFLGLFLFLRSVSLSALQDPGRWESFLAARAKRYLVSRAARVPLSARPPEDAAGTSAAEMNFDMDCSSCHGKDGRTPTSIGKGMYPRAVDLGSPGVQRWSDAELFWIIKNGIRLSGMPGFGKSESDADIWHMVNHLRHLQAAHTK